MRCRAPVGLVVFGITIGSALLASGCKGGPTVPSPVPVPGATLVRGTERLAWSQAGDVSALRFRAWIDDVPMLLEAAVCDASTPEATCSAPLPPMSDGVHTLALSSLLEAFGLESDRSEKLVLQKVSSGTRSLASLPDGGAGTRAVRLQSTIQLAEAVTFTTDVVARGIRAPAQLTATPDGRLLVAEADGSVRVVRLDRMDRAVRARDVNARPIAGDAPVTAAPGLAVHPDFATNHFVYAAVLEPGRQPVARLRVMRLREVGDTLGDAATLFETTVIDRRRATGSASQQAARVEGPRLAFGPDRLLYIALPPGFEFDREPAASSPHASMLRLGDDGLPAGVGPITGVRAHPLAFTWDPSSRALWLAFDDGRGATVLEPAVSMRNLSRALDRLRLPAVSRMFGSSRTLVVGGDTIETPTRDLLRRLMVTRGSLFSNVVRLNTPVVAGDLADRIGDITSGPGGTWFVVTSNSTRAGGTGTDDGDVVVRLTPVGAREAN